MTSLGDVISRTPAGRALCGAHGQPWLFQLLELEPQPHWECLGMLGNAWDCLGMPDPPGPKEHSSDQAGCCACPSCHWRSGTQPRQQTHSDQSLGSPGTCVWELLDSCLPQCCSCSSCSQSQRMGWGGNPAEPKSVSQSHYGVTGIQPAEPFPPCRGGSHTKSEV